MAEERTICERVEAELRDLVALVPEPDMDADALAALVADRQRIIDRIAAIDGSLAVLRSAIDGSEAARALLAEASDLDRRINDALVAERDRLRGAIEKTQKGRKAAQGYRLGIKRSPIIVDSSA